MASRQPGSPNPDPNPNLTRQGPRFVVQVGDKAIDYNESFTLYMTTRNPSPDVPPDVASLVTLVNFSVTTSGLEGQP